MKERLAELRFKGLVVHKRGVFGETIDDLDSAMKFGSPYT
jgi:hypothetical protein